MPEVHVDVRWPDGRAQSIYSPSLVVEDYFAPGTAYPVAEFVGRSREALGIASDRVRAKYGFPCSLAAGSLSSIESTASSYPAGGEVTVVALRR